MLHTWEHFVGDDLPANSEFKSSYELYQLVVGTVFNYAALYVLSLSFFLWGWKGFRLQKTKLIVLILGLIGLQLRQPEVPWDFTSWAWEVYGFLIIAVLICRFWPRRLNWAVGMFAFSVIPLSLSLNIWIPIADQTVEPWRSIFFANRETPATIGWFLVPWICVPTLAYGAGLILQLRTSAIGWIREKAYVLALLLGLISALLYWIKPNPVPAFLGTHFYQFLFMQTAAHFWNHYLIFMAVIILCLRLERSHWIQNSPLKYLSYLQWNRNFFFCYFFHFSLIVFLLRWHAEIVVQPHLLDWLWLGIFLLTELMIQIFVASLKMYAYLWRWFQKRIKTKAAV